jgi:hypothetical protein
MARQLLIEMYDYPGNPAILFSWWHGNCEKRESARTKVEKKNVNKMSTIETVT